MRGGVGRGWTAMSWVYPALDAVGAGLPGMVERGTGTLLFGTGTFSAL
ncbi:hypothetical protein GCM10009801_26520 [Streptomyces albiaxialis]|uniref:Uncharacterized protein n=1 Tax=Streptomyces albiaxialis TaxID=329523 RepID=A0ABN2VUI0_9ACTN